MADSTIQIPYVNFGAQWQDDRDDLLPIIDNLLGSGHYVGGAEIDRFEEQIAKLCQVRYALALITEDIYDSSFALIYCIR